MSYLLLLLFFAVQTIQNPSICSALNTKDMPSAALPYASARKLSVLEVALTSQIYSNITEIKEYQIKISTAMCPGWGGNCTSDTSVATFDGSDDIWIVFPQLHTLNCNQEWQLLISCGTYLQVHKPFDARVLIKTQISTVVDGPFTINLTLASLCAGTYHVWLVYYTRIGRIVVATTPIYIGYPSCVCS